MTNRRLYTRARMREIAARFLMLCSALLLVALAAIILFLNIEPLFWELR